METGGAEGAKAPSEGHRGRLQVDIIGARGIQNTESWGKQDPYAVVELDPGPPGQRCATKTAMNGGTDPRWHEQDVLEVDHSSEHVRVALYNQNRAMPDDLIGTGTLSLGTVFDAPEAVREEWSQHDVPITSHPSGCTEGGVRLRLRWLPGRPPLSSKMAAAAPERGADRAVLYDKGEAGPLAADAAHNAPEACDLRQVINEEEVYDRVNRPGYNVPGSHEVAFKGI